MDQSTIQIFFPLLRSAVFGTKLTEEERNHYAPDMLQDLLNLSSKHDIAHLLVFGLKQNALLLKENAELEKCILKAIYRYEMIKREYEKLCAALEKAEIPFLPLKGSVLRQYYPEPWMRTSCDIDILVQAEQLERAIAAIKEMLQYTDGSKSNHDVSLFSPNGVHVELHYDTVVEGNAIKKSHTVLSHIWETACPKQPGMYQYDLTDAMFYFYHIAHMAKHFQIGGCGIRPFLDLWILKHRVEHDGEARKQLLDQGGLLAFAQAAESLSEVWFSGAESDPMTDRLAQYILGGGVYGTMENIVIVQQGRRGGKLRYALTRIFLPYETIKYYYPVLQKHKWLLPVYQVVRWCKLLFKGGVKRSVRELKTNASMSRADMQSAEALLQYLDL